MQENQIARREFDYYGPSLPSSPATAQTWRELTSQGRWVKDWVWLAGVWASIETHLTVPFANSNTNSATPNDRSPPSPSPFLYRGGVAGPGLTGWSLNFQLRPWGSVSFAVAGPSTALGASLSQWTPWYLSAEDTFIVRAWSIPPTPSGSPTASFRHWVEFKSIRP